MDEKLNKRKAFIINFLFFIIVVGVFYVVLKKLFPIFLPFVIGLAIAVLLNPLIRFLTDKTKRHFQKFRKKTKRRFLSSLIFG